MLSAGIKPLTCFCTWSVVLTAPALFVPAFAADIGAGAALQPSELAIFFDIPQQPLTAALYTFSAQADLQIFYESALTQGRQSTAIKGSFRPREALQLLLAKSNLTAVFSDPKTLTLHAAVPIFYSNDALTVPPLRLTLQTLFIKTEAKPVDTDYTGLIALGLQRALRRNAKTRAGDYMVDARLWIGNDGAVLRAELTGTSGDKSRDDAIFLTLKQFVVSREPPLDFPKPVTVSITVKPL
jgi:hypothetical protein